MTITNLFLVFKSGSAIGRKDTRERGRDDDPEAAIAIYEDVAQASHPGMMENSVTMATDLAKLGYLYEQAGYPDRSRDYLERALAMYEVTQVPTSPRLRDVQKALDRLGGD